MNDYILEIRDLAIQFYTDDGDVAAVGGVDLKLERGRENHYRKGDPSADSQSPRQDHLR